MIKSFSTLLNRVMISPKIITSIDDVNGNELFLLTPTSSAVNEFTIANAATGAGPTLSATGSDSNIDINISPKGAGKINIPGKIALSTGNAQNALTITTGPGITNAGIQLINAGGTVTINNGYGPFEVTVGGAMRLEITTAGATRPGVNNSTSLGDGTKRWTEVFATNGVINTSDLNEKQDIDKLSEAEKRVAQKIKILIKKFRFKSAVEKKGNLARTHFGVIAQEVVEAFKSENLDPFQYGVVCFDKWDDIVKPIFEEKQILDENENVKIVSVQTGEYIETPAGESYGIRYEQLLTFVVASI